MPHVPRLARTALVVAVGAAALVGTGCGNKESVVTNAATEGIWIDAGPLDYHIQGSRLLEPGQVPDASYLKGVPSDVAQPTGKEVWFAVFLRIENKTKKAARTADDFEIVDTQGDTYRPLALNTNVNPFAYKAMNLAPDKVVPVPDSAQDFDSVSGAELLFKIPLTSYQNRPLEFRVHSADGAAPAVASVDLDV
jgi:hypothetical protein